jgi:hypothetical protein
MSKAREVFMFAALTPLALLAVGLVCWIISNDQVVP